MKFNTILLLSVLTFGNNVLAQSIIKSTEPPVNIIYETDMCLDVDDVGALAVLHGLQNEKKVNLLGVCYNEVHPLGASVIDAINTWYNRGNIPIGIYMNYDKAFKDPDPSDYFTHERSFDVDNMPHDPFDNIVGCAIAVYKHILKNQADNSVVATLWNDKKVTFKKQTHQDTVYWATTNPKTGEVYQIRYDGKLRIQKQN